MLLFGHTGITLGVAWLVDEISLRRARLRQPTDMKAPTGPATASSASVRLPGWKNVQPRTTLSRSKKVFYGLLLLGSMLPDIIDKPVGQSFFRETFSNGRIFCHTLLFLILITMAGLYLQRYRSKTWLLALSFGTFTHLVFDEMWRAPRTLLWPIYGFTFDKIDLTGWAGNMLHALLRDPETWITELVGAAMLFWFAALLLRRRKAFAFIKSGKI
jgi:hypothetical protein